MPAPTATLRPAQAADVPAIAGLIHELAAFEQLAHLVQLEAPRLQEHLFGPVPKCHAWVATVPPAASQGAHERESGSEGEVVAFALYFYNYSTFLGRPGLYLEDLYVKPAFRGLGVGKALLARLARQAVEEGCGRFEWSVLDWNTQAIGFYEKLGASVLPDWRICRVTGQELQALAAQADGDA